MSKPVIFEDSLLAKVLRRSLNLNDLCSVLSGDDDPTSVAKTAPQGSIYMRTGASGGNLFTKDDAGSSTNWTVLLSSAASVSDRFFALEDVGVSTSVAASALTINTKRADGTTDGSGGNPIRVPFRSTTIASGSFSIQQITGADSIVIPSGATMGHTSAVDEQLYFYDTYDGTNHGRGVSSSYFPEGGIYNTTILDTSSDAKGVIYTAVARTGVAVRLLAVLKSNQTVAGTWDAVPTEIDLSGESTEDVNLLYQNNGGEVITANVTNITWANKVRDSHDAWDGTTFTAPMPGIYHAVGRTFWTASNSANHTSYVDAVALRTNTTGFGGSSTVRTFTDEVRLDTGEALTFRSTGSFTLDSNNLHWIAIHRIGGRR